MFSIKTVFWGVSIIPFFTNSFLTIISIFLHFWVQKSLLHRMVQNHLIISKSDRVISGSLQLTKLVFIRSFSKWTFFIFKLKNLFLPLLKKKNSIHFETMEINVSSVREHFLWQTHNDISSLNVKKRSFTK